MTTGEKLLQQARLQFWTRGYSNVSVRSISAAAGVDVALIARHFGSKLGLFTASLDHGYDALSLPADPAQLEEYVIALFSQTPRGAAAPSLIQMITSNAHDETVGPMVRDLHRTRLQEPLERLIGRADRAALFMAALIGFAVTEKTLHLAAIARPGSPAYETQLRQLIRAALRFED
ncbi:TetR/AcrR family transcriptional regulator [Pseudooceanicola sp.]|uniref:TetR/AcrR family transcriptional regulator n=1 Tax=Pseudooceanicola sp. TaxID=1914328 RepID=UPI002606A70B|nr:TetR/AcrR family transcriptional regulator [Pseudooceanicola sp.]MDF1856732.1 TetR family transcriptional regulator [Pseudooceanicola sp.]